MRLIFVGPDPDSPHIAHPGGQLTATRGFAAFAVNRGISIEWIDTAQSSFPVPPMPLRLARSLLRLGRFARAIVQGGQQGALLFAGTGASFFERSLMVILARLAGIPTVLMIASGHFESFYARHPFSHGLIRALLNIPHRVVVQGENWQTYMKSIGVDPRRIAVIRNWYVPAPTAVQRIDNPGNCVRFIFVGWITAAKGVVELLSAAKILARAGRQFHLTLLGGGDMLESLRSEVAGNHLTDVISLPGWVDSPSVFAHLAAADVFVLPSHAEGLPNSLIEAMAAGLPGIATPVGAIPNTLQDGVAGTIVPICDAPALAEAMRSYCDDRSLIERQSRAAREAVSVLHDAERNCQAIIDLLSSPNSLPMKPAVAST